uniref:DOCKER domain-containing protein n=1 Tax=Plectus sambesii TaxID=2011161 RepID=A0A914XB44_9BILA
MWERSIGLCDELTIFYRSGIFNYRKLSASLRQSADLFETILTSGQRETHAYFRVAFCGPAFSATIRDKVFVFRGSSFDTLASFSERISSEWPDVTVVIRHKEPVTDVTGTDNSDKSVVRVSRLRPVPDDQRPEASGADVPELIKAYYLNSDVSTFELVRPFRRGSHDSVYSERCSDFQNLWTERTTLKTRAALPTIVPWSEVVSEKTELVSPVQTACECVRDKNAELRRAMDACMRQMVDQDQNSLFSQHLLMILKGTIEAAVNGGIIVYQNAFFTPDYYGKYTTETTHLNELRRLIWDQLFLLDRGLQLSGKLVHNDCRPLQDHLIKVFGRLWKDVRRELDSPQVRRVLLGDQSKASLPPTPPDRHSSYNNETLADKSLLMVPTANNSETLAHKLSSVFATFE